jgi:hypothetical protein
MQLRHLGLLAMMLSILSHHVISQTSATDVTVTGRVVDSDGRPVDGARISIFPMDQAISGSLPQAFTDRDGRYTLVIPPFSGRTRFCAVKESAGYPDTQGLLFKSETSYMPIEHLMAGTRITVDIKLGQPDGTIEGLIIDGKTHSAVPRARIMLRRDDPQAMYSATVPTDGHFIFALPPVPISLAVTAPGYKPWIYEQKNSQTEKFVLKPTDRKLVTVELWPE